MLFEKTKINEKETREEPLKKGADEIIKATNRSSTQTK